MLQQRAGVDGQHPELDAQGALRLQSVAADAQHQGSRGVEARDLGGITLFMNYNCIINQFRIRIETGDLAGNYIINHT